MSKTEPQPFDDAYASLIAACDEALAVSQRTDVTADTPITPALQSQVQDALECIRMLRKRWPRPGGDTDNDAEKTTLHGPSTLGRFEILRELGSGSFGQVFLAHDPLLARQVALKVPRFDVSAAPDLHERFRREAKAAAGLEHPNIVQVFEAGDAGEACYIASAYCPGPTMAAWLKQQTAPVPLRTAASMLAALADGVQHAHSRGVLHRDLKPGNILMQGVDSSQYSVASREHTPDSSSTDYCLLTTDYSPKITDFGLAKIESDDALQATQSGAMLGTPQYMAPEQAGGRKEQVGPPADIYALGVILYEMLIGRPPFQADSVMELLLLVKDAEPVALRRLRPGISVDLETICLKCLQKQPEKRYAIAGELAADLRRFLNGEPIVARPVGWWERLRKWIRRKPALAALSAGMVVVVTGSLAGLTALYLHAEKERKDAIDARKRMEQSESLAKSINHFFLEDVVSAAQPKGIGLGKDVTLREALNAAIPKISQTLAAQPLAEAGVCDAAGQAYKSLGEYKQALPLLRRAVAIREQELGNADVHTLESRLGLAIVVLSLGETDEAVKINRECLDVASRVYGTTHEITLHALDNLIHSLRLKDEDDEANQLVTSLAERSEAKWGSEHIRTRQAWLNAALVAMPAENVKAESILRRLWEDGKRLEGPDDPETLVVEGKLGEVLQMLGRLDEAEAILRRNVEARLRVLGNDDPGNFTMQGSLALVLKSQRRFADAAVLYDEAIKGYLRTVPEHFVVGYTQSHYGETLTELGRYAEAEHVLKEGYENLVKNNQPHLALTAARRLATLYQKWGKTDQEALWRATAEKLQSGQKP